MFNIFYSVYANFGFINDDGSKSENSNVERLGGSNSFSEAKEVADNSNWLKEDWRIKRLNFIEVVEVHPFKDGKVIYKITKNNDGTFTKQF